MIQELYALDSVLTEQLVSNNITIEIQEKVSASAWSGHVLPPEHIVSESLEIKQSICDDKELRIGGCIPSQLTLSVLDTEDLSGKRIAVKISTTYLSYILCPETDLYPSSELYPSKEAQEQQTDEYYLFLGTIDSCKKGKNYHVRKLIAFDRLYYASRFYCKNRIYNYLKKHDTNTIYFRTFYSWLSPRMRCDALSQSNCVNWFEKLDMIDDAFFDSADKKITYLTVLKAMCELNGIFLIEDSPTNVTGNLSRPRVVAPFADLNTVYDIASYSDLQYDNFIAKKVRYVQFSYAAGKYFAYYSNAGLEKEEYSKYYSENILTNSLTTSTDVLPLLRNLHGSADGIERVLGSIYAFRPFKADVFNRWWVQCGDRIRIPTDDPDVSAVESIVLRRTIKGINNIAVTIEAKGVEAFGKENDDDIE